MIYLDHAATAPLHLQALEAMQPLLTEQYGNPSSLHRLGREALEAMETARRQMADVLGAEPDEIIFTGSGSESDNLAIRGVALAAGGSGDHVITSMVEHHAVLHTCQALEEEFGFDVTYLPVDDRGLVDPQDVIEAINDRTILISIMVANNEVGSIQPITEIGRSARGRGIPFHTDAVQAAGALALNVHALGVDLLSLSAHKFGGPKGVGILYGREGISLRSQQTGGVQEMGRRAGTENVAGIVGAAKALKLAEEARQIHNRHLVGLRDRLIAGVLDGVEGAQLTGHPVERLPNSASFVIPGVESETLLMALDRAGVCASAGSACSTGSSEPSHVLLAMGLPTELAGGSLRLTLGPENTVEEVEKVLGLLPEAVSLARALVGAEEMHSVQAE